MSSVDVIIGTYNHQPYIEQALDSVLMQQTTFPMMIHVADDCSTDGTQEILRRYQDRYPDRIKLALDTQNRGLLSKERKFLQMLTSSQADYIALLEGDDYWTDPHKLQKQVAFLEANPEYVICYHNARIIDEKGAVLESSKLSDDRKIDFSQDDLIRGEMVLTLTICYRNVLKEIPDEYLKVRNGDKFLTSLLGNFGRGKYLPDIADAVYRKHSAAVWSSLDKMNQQFHNGNTRAWMYRYYKRIGNHDHADFFKVEAVKRFKRVLKEIAGSDGSEYGNMIHGIFTDYSDIIDEATEKRLRKLLKPMKATIHTGSSEMKQIHSLTHEIPDQSASSSEGQEPLSREYKSCTYLENAAAFYYDNLVYTCCYPEYIKEEGILADLSQAPISIDELISKKKAIILRRMNGECGGCASCPKIMEKQWRKDWRFTITHVTLNHLLACNLRCAYCGYVEKKGHAQPTKAAIIIDSIRKLEESGLLDPQAAFYIGNGEPSINKDMDDLILYLLNKDYKIVVQSNGTVYKEIYASGINANKIRLTLTPDAGNETSYKQIKGKDFFHIVWRNIKRYASETNGNVTVKIIMQEENVNDIESIVDLCVASRVKHIVVDVDINIRDHLSPPIASALERFLEYARCKNVKIRPGVHWPRDILKGFEARSKQVGDHAEDARPYDNPVNAIPKRDRQSQRSSLDEGVADSTCSTQRILEVDMVAPVLIAREHQTPAGLLLTSELISTHQPAMVNNAKINWLLTRRCNYKCTYCSVKDNMNGYFHDIEALKEAVNKLSLIKKENIRLSLTGGEPTIHPNYIEFLQHIFDTFGKRAYITTITNLSMPLSFFDKVVSSLADYLDYIHFAASYHFEFANKDRFLANVHHLTHKGIPIMVQILAHPEYMDTVQVLYDSLLRMGTNKLTIDLKLIRDVSANPDKNYSDQDLAWLKAYYHESEIKSLNVQLLRQDKTIECLDISPNELIAHNQNGFNGFECFAGIESLCINANGDIDPATCFRKTKGHKPNIFKDEDPIGFFQRPVICPFDKCKCLFDLHLSKRHPNYRRITQSCNPQEIRSIEGMLEEKGWQSKTGRYADQFESAQSFNTVESPAVSIIVISWRLHPDNLINFQILDKQRDQNYELIFVDNGGEAGEFEPLKPFIDTYVRLRSNTGAYLARNIGSVFAKAPILIFLEDDGIPEHDFVETHLKAHQKYDVIAVRGVYRPKTDTVINRLADHYYLGDVPFPRPGNLEGNMSYLAKPFFAVGGWDDDIVFGYGGYDLALRLLKIEPDLRKQIYSPEPVIYHDFASNAEHLAAKKKKQENSLLRLKTIHPQWDALLNGWKKYTRRYDLLIYKELPYDAGTVERFTNKRKFAEAISYLKKIMAEKPQEAAVHNALGVVYSRQGQKGQALEHLLEAVRLESHNATYQKNLAGVYLEQQKLKESFDLYQSIVRFYPDDTDSLMALAGINCLMSRFGEAWRLWNMVLKIDPEHKIAQQKLHEFGIKDVVDTEDTREETGMTAEMLVRTKSMLSVVLQFYEEGHMEKADHQLKECIHLLKDSYQ